MGFGKLLWRLGRANRTGEDEALDVLGQLCELFVAENGRDPNDEEISQWAQTLKEAAAEGLQM